MSNWNKEDIVVLVSIVVGIVVFFLLFDYALNLPYIGRYMVMGLAAYGFITLVNKVWGYIFD